MIASGNDRDDYGLGSTGSPGTAPDAISVAAVSNSHVFAPALSVVGGPPSLGAVPIQIFGSPDLGERSTRRSSTSRPSSAPTASRPTRTSAARQPIRTAGSAPPDRLTEGQDRPRLARPLQLRVQGCSCAPRRRRRDRPRRQPPGEANPIPIAAARPRRHDRRPRRPGAARVRRRERRPGPIRVSTDVRELPTNRGGVITSFSSAGPTDFDHRLKPDISAPGLDVLSSTPPADDRLDVLGLRGHLDGDTARRRSGRAAAAAAPGLVVVAGEVGADVDRGRRRGATPRARRRRPCCSRAPASRTC